MSNSRRVEGLGRSEEYFRLPGEYAGDHAFSAPGPEGCDVGRIFGERFSRLHLPEGAERGRPERGGWWVRKEGGSRFRGSGLTATFGEERDPCEAPPW